MAKNDRPGAVELLKEDHDKFRELFKKFEKAEDDEKEEIADQVDLELRVHSMIEEEILYPSFKDLDSEIVAESFEEHGVVEELLNELATMELTDDQFEAKFKVMQENVEHHLEEEEESMFPHCPKLADYDNIGMRLIQRKLELLDELRADEPSGRATADEPATMKASEKSEALMTAPSGNERSASASDKTVESPKTKSGSEPRSKAAAGSRSRRATATAGRKRK